MQGGVELKQYFRAAVWLIVGILSTLLVISLTNQNGIPNQSALSAGSLPAAPTAAASHDATNDVKALHSTIHALEARLASVMEVLSNTTSTLHQHQHQQQGQQQQPQVTQSTGAAPPACEKSSPAVVVTDATGQRMCPPTKWMPTFRHRGELGGILKDLKMKVGVELGVQQGQYAVQLLQQWKIAEEYVMVDLWAQQENYHDIANIDNAAQNRFKTTSISSGQSMVRAGNLKKLSICQNYTIHCATNYPNEYFDFIYVDARHDYKGVLQDLATWWPKLKQGGIIAGHDYVVNAEVMPGQDWSINFDGTKDTTGLVVKGAVDDFFSDKTGHMAGCPRQITLGYREKMWNTWATRK